MSDADRVGDDPLPPTFAERVDAACDRFEAAWKAGERPRIEEHLDGAAESERPALLGELLALQWGDIGWNDRFIAVRRNIVRGKLTTPKSHQQRRVDMSPQLMEALHSWAKQNDYEAVRFECHNQHRAMLHLAINQEYDFIGIRWDSDRGDNLIQLQKTF